MPTVGHPPLLPTTQCWGPGQGTVSLVLEGLLTVSPGLEAGNREEGVTPEPLLSVKAGSSKVTAK